MQVRKSFIELMLELAEKDFDLVVYANDNTETVFELETVLLSRIWSTALHYVTLLEQLKEEKIIKHSHIDLFIDIAIDGLNKIKDGDLSCIKDRVKH